MSRQTLFKQKFKKYALKNINKQSQTSSHVSGSSARLPYALTNLMSLNLFFNKQSNQKRKRKRKRQNDMRFHVH